MRRWVAVVCLLAAACSDGGEPATTSTTPVAPASGDACYSAPITDPSSGTTTFDDVTDDMGLASLAGIYGHAAATADVDDDGWLDLFVGTFADREDAPVPDRLFLGGPDGFTEDDSFPGELGRTSGATFADLDGDDDLDLVVTRNPRDGNDIKERPTTIYEYDDGFDVRTTLLERQPARAAAVLDFDEDGLLDLFVSVDEGSSVLLHNDGDFEFSEADFADDVAGFGVGAADLDLDGHTDLVIAGANRVFMGDGDGGFEDATPDGFDWETFGDEDLVTGIALGDLDRNGRLDIVVGHHFNSTVDDGERVPIRAFLNHEDGFEELDGLPAFETKPSHVEVVDFDNDGWPDILTTASAGDGAYPAVLRNEQGDGFSEPDGLGDPRYWVTGATGDFDHDGRVDVFVLAIDPSEPSLLLRNTGPSGHWLEVHGAVGTWIEVNEARFEVVASTGYAGGAAPRVHVGLGDATEVQIVRPDGIDLGVFADQSC